MSRHIWPLVLLFLVISASEDLPQSQTAVKACQQPTDDEPDITTYDMMAAFRFDEFLLAGNLKGIQKIVGTTSFQTAYQFEPIANLTIGAVRVFPRGVPTEFAFECTFRLTETQQSADIWPLVALSDSRNDILLSITLSAHNNNNNNNHTIELVLPQADGTRCRTQTLTFKEETTQLNDQSWHKLVFGITQNAANLWIDCKPVPDVWGNYTLPLAPRAPIDMTDGTFSLARDRRTNATVPIDIQWMLLSCDAHRPSRTNCEDLTGHGHAKVLPAHFTVDAEEVTLAGTEPSAPQSLTGPIGPPADIQYLRGEKGEPGVPGLPAEPAICTTVTSSQSLLADEVRDICFAVVKDYIAEHAKDLTGPRGQRGLRGAKGMSGIPGETGAMGPKGEVGTPGRECADRPGSPGERGERDEKVETGSPPGDNADYQLSEDELAYAMTHTVQQQQQQVRRSINNPREYYNKKGAQEYYNTEGAKEYYNIKGAKEYYNKKGPQEFYDNKTPQVYYDKNPLQYYVKEPWEVRTKMTRGQETRTKAEHTKADEGGEAKNDETETADLPTPEIEVTDEDATAGIKLDESKPIEPGKAGKAQVQPKDSKPPHLDVKATKKLLADNNDDNMVADSTKQS